MEEGDITDLFIAGAPTQDDAGPDWESGVLEADEPEDAPTRPELERARIEGRVTRRFRARQHAVELAREFGWDDAGIEILTDVFDRYWWSQSKVSMRREMTAGMAPEELRLAMQLRDVWANHPEMAVDFSRLESGSLLGCASPIYQRLSWPLALALVRATEWLPDSDEIEQRLCEQFDQWYSSPTLQRTFRSFQGLVYYQATSQAESLRGGMDWTFAPDRDLRLDLDEAFQPGCVTEEYRLLDRLDLLPTQSCVARQRRPPKHRFSAFALGQSHPD